MTIIGSVLLGLFADTAVNAAGRDGVFFGGGWGLMLEQCIAVAATVVFSLVVTTLIALVLRAVMPGGIRASAEDEETGLDLSQHSETAYSFDRV